MHRPLTTSLLALFLAHALAAAEPEPAWQPLFDGKSLKGWSVIDFAGHGGASVTEDGALQVEMGIALSGVAYTNPVPKVDYEVSLKARKVAGADFFCGLTVPVRDSHCTLVIGGWGGGVLGVSSIDGLDAAENETSKVLYFETGRWFDIRFRVTAERLTAWIDEEKLIDVNINDRRVDMRAGEIEIAKPFSLSTYATTAQYKDIKLRTLAAAKPTASTGKRPPNIVMIISDDHAWWDYGFMGHPHVQTPRLDRLANESLLFPRGYVPASLCCPSLASIITGLYPHQHRVVCNDPPGAGQFPNRRAFYDSQLYRDGRERMSDFIENAATLPRLLQQRGYVSLQTGKWWQNHFSRGGFTHGMTVGDEDKGGRHGDKGLEIGRKTMEPIYNFVDEAVKEEKPFLVWYAPFLPHDPHTPPDRLFEKYQGKAESDKVAKYWGMIEWFDETCGALLDFLDDRKLAENTIVVYVTDNGWITDPETGRYAPRSKQSPYDGGLRTPIMIRWPGQVAARQSDVPVSSIDLMPTLLHAADIQARDPLPGENLLDEAVLAKRKSVYGACFTHDGVDLDRPSTGLRWRWVVSGGWKLILPDAKNQPDDKVELYRINSDPFERENLAGVEPELVARLRKLTDNWWDGEE
ncbi:MAG TPA: hypothetical protein DCY13_08430 [Verrucomicrobiales bacterium]|nr:hypothetical protein [Verrucomicrobiales bacterium]